MKLSKRVMILLAAGLVVIISVSGTYFYFSFNSFLTNHERISIESDLDQLLKELEIKQERLLLIANDWIRRDITSRIIDPLNMNFFLQYSKNTGFTQYSYVDTNTGEDIIFPENLKTNLIETIATKDDFESFSSIYYFGGKYYYISALKINDLSITAQKNLVTIVGKEIDSAEFNNLAEIIGGDLTFVPPNDIDFDHNISFDFNNDIVISGVIENSQTNTITPPIGINIIKERDLFNQGRVQLLSILIFYFIALFILGAFSVILINKIIFKPLFNTAKQISEYNISDFSDKPVALGRYDEISSLKRAINGMVEKINQEHVKVQKSEHLFRTIFDQAPMGIALSDSKSFKMRNLNRKFCEILKIEDCDNIEYSDMEIDWRKITHPDDVEEDATNMQNLINGDINSYSMNKRYILDDGEIIWVSMRVAKINSDDEDYPLAICMVNDITSYKKSEDEIRRLTFKDILTGLYNRTYFEKKKKEIANSNSYPLSVIMCDINGLKLMNDGFGHHYGDNLIILASELIREACAPHELIFRIGGDEFCILLPNVSFTQAQELCKKIEKKCSDISENITDIFYISVATGVKTSTVPNKNIEELIKDAEDSMQKQKISTRVKNHMELAHNLFQILLNKKIESKTRINRLSEMSEQLKNIFGLTNRDLNNLKLLSRIHNIGKIRISSTIFNSTEPLTEDELREIKKHPDIGYRISSVIDEYCTISNLILTHHERWDGSGYPQGLKEKQIPKLSRIFALMDSFDAMTHDRPYRKALSKSQAIEEIENNLGSQFDPEIASKFIDYIKNN